MRVFDNGTVWWFLKQCVNPPNTLTDGKNDFICKTADDSLDQRREATQIRWYQTTGSTLNNTRIVYYTNGTVNRETWNWATVNGVPNTRTFTRDAVLVKSPRGDYVPFVETARGDVSSDPINSLWLYSKNIGYKRVYTNVTAAAGPPAISEVTSTFYYFNDPGTATNWDGSLMSGLPDQQKETIKNIGEYYIWDMLESHPSFDCTENTVYYPNTPTVNPLDDRACIQIMYRNGSQAIYKQTGTTPAGTRRML